MVHAIGLGPALFAVAILLGACAAPPPPAGTLHGARTGWFYPRGPYTTIRTSPDGPERTRVGPETGGRWTVNIGEPPTTIHATRLPDGRPATISIAEPARGETVVFDPPQALVPRPDATTPATEESSVTLYQGLSVEPGQSPKRTGTATRTFFGIEPATWTKNGTTHPAQRMHHELLLDFGAAKVRQRYESLAVQRLGIVRETVTQRVTFLGVRISGSERTTELTEFDEPR
ncbi:MAG: hypothetical protein ACIAS6_10765 [Phycisphaerales bacterium JB060]